MRRESIKRLVVRAPNWIGDAVMCEPALRGLRALFPTAELTLLAKPPVAELFIAYRGLDRVLVYDDKRTHAGLAGKWALAQMVRRHQFNLAVLFQNAFEAAFLTWLAGVPRRYGYATDGRAFFLTDLVAVPDRGVLTHQVGYYWNLLKPLGMVGEPAAPALVVSADEERAFETRLTAAGITPSDYVIGLNPGSTNGSAKRWLPERFAEVADRLQGELGVQRARVMIVGARGEEALGAAIAERMRIKPVVYSGQTTIRELMAAIKRCGLFLTNDTGPMHIAAAFGVPMVVIFGSSDSTTTGPFGNKEAVVRQSVECAPCLLKECPIDHRCMTRVSVEQVYETAVKQLVHSYQPSAISRESSETAHHASPITHYAPLQGVTVFLDRDGTLNPDPGYIRSPEQFELFPGVPEALATLQRAGARLIVVTNQSGIARGFFSVEDLGAIHNKLRRILAAAGVSLDAIYFCPHHPDEGCRCRKPATGMIDQAAGDLGIDLSRAYVIGDQARDVQLAKRIGSRSVLVTTGEGSAEALHALNLEGAPPDAVAPSLGKAVEWIIADAANRVQQSAISLQHEPKSLAEKLTADS